jgi:hypothetical protein
MKTALALCCLALALSGCKKPAETETSKAQSAMEVAVKPFTIGDTVSNDMGVEPASDLSANPNGEMTMQQEASPAQAVPSTVGTVANAEAETPAEELTVVDPAKP